MTGPGRRHFSKEEIKMQARKAAKMHTNTLEPITLAPWEKSQMFTDPMIPRRQIFEPLPVENFQPNVNLQLPQFISRAPQFPPTLTFLKSETFDQGPKHLGLG
ncbi:MAG: hypothetical protein LBF22_13975 [Deltaproteobacteria bacterium]|jgi:hypothetical protein|nr:hypothetical protein [Deltaproteobacteria bacterium]